MSASTKLTRIAPQDNSGDIPDKKSPNSAIRVITSAEPQNPEGLPNSSQVINALLAKVKFSAVSTTSKLQLCIFISALFLLLPLANRTTFTSLDTTKLSQTIANPLYLNILTGAIYFAIPLVINAFFDMLDFLICSSDELDHILSNVLGIIALILPSILILFHHHFPPNNTSCNETWFVCVHAFQHVLYKGLVLMLLYTNDSNNYTLTTTACLCSISYTSAVFELFGLAYSNRYLQLTSIILNLIYYGWVIILFSRYLYQIFCTYSEYLLKWKILSIYMNFSVKEYTTLCNLSTITITLTIHLLVSFISQQNIMYSQNISIEYFFSYYVSSILYLFIINISPNRSYKYLSRVLQNRLKVKQNYVRYIGHEIRYLCLFIYYTTLGVY